MVPEPVRVSVCVLFKDELIETFRLFSNTKNKEEECSIHEKFQLAPLADRLSG